MKRAIFFIVMAAYAVGCLQAQDTIWTKPAPLNNYYHSHWIDTNTVRYMGYEMAFGVSKAIAKQFVTKDTLRVYGIAAMMVNHYFVCIGSTPSQIQASMELSFPEDPSFDNCQESLMLFQYSGGSMQQLGDSLPVHNIYTPVSYYIISEREPLSFLDTVPKPVYERYFTTPQAVYDTFFAGYTQSHWAFNDKDSIWYERRPSFCCLAFEPWNPCRSEEVGVFRVDTVHVWWDFLGDQIPGHYFIFPILTSEPNIDTTTTDTTVVDTGDTVSVRMADYMSRYVSVSPNPAKDAAQVLSSFGISRMELFNAAGARVLDKPASGLKATLDLSRIPAGTYFLRITTPMGATMKKLTVTR